MKNKRTQLHPSPSIAKATQDTIFEDFELSFNLLKERQVNLQLKISSCSTSPQACDSSARFLPSKGSDSISMVEPIYQSPKRERQPISPQLKKRSPHSVNVTPTKSRIKTQTSASALLINILIKRFSRIQLQGFVAIKRSAEVIQAKYEHAIQYTLFRTLQRCFNKLKRQLAPKPSLKSTSPKSISPFKSESKKLVASYLNNFEIRDSKTTHKRNHTGQLIQRKTTQKNKNSSSKKTSPHLSVSLRQKTQTAVPKLEQQQQQLGYYRFKLQLKYFIRLKKLAMLRVEKCKSFLRFQEIRQVRQIFNKWFYLPTQRQKEQDITKNRKQQLLRRMFRIWACSMIRKGAATARSEKQVHSVTPPRDPIPRSHSSQKKSTSARKFLRNEQTFFSRK